MLTFGYDVVRALRKGTQLKLDQREFPGGDSAEAKLNGSQALAWRSSTA